MRRFLAAVLFGVLAAAPTAVTAQSPQAQAIVSEWYSRFLHRPVDSGAIGWEGGLDQGQNPDTILSGILGSDEFYLDSGSTPQGYVQTLFTDVNDRPPTPAEDAFWLNRLVQLGGAAPDPEVRTDVAYEMLVRYPQNWVSVAPAYVAPTVVSPTIVEPNVVVRPGIEFDRRFHDHDDRFEYHRPPVAPIHREIEHREEHGRPDEHGRKR